MYTTIPLVMFCLSRLTQKKNFPEKRDKCKLAHACVNSVNAESYTHQNKYRSVDYFSHNYYFIHVHDYAHIYVLSIGPYSWWGVKWCQFLLQVICTLETVLLRWLWLCCEFLGKRPFGVSILYMGWDQHYGFQLYQSDPSGNYGGWKATCIGNNSAVSAAIKSSYL